MITNRCRHEVRSCMAISAYDVDVFLKIREIILSDLSYLMTISWSFAYPEEQHALHKKKQTQVKN